jgi:protein required for attachment to host cells
VTKLTKGTWIVIADGEKVLFLENVTDADDPNLKVIGVEATENPATHAQGEDRPGRRADGGPGHRSAMEETDWHRLGKDRFAHDLAAQLYTAAHAGRFDRLVLVAAPHTLGALRKSLHGAVVDRIVAEIASDLTNLPRDEIERHVIRALSEG